MKRKRKEKTEEQKLLTKIRKSLPSHIVEVEISVQREQEFRLFSIQEHLRIIRNTVLGELLRNYKQMARTKEYKKLLKRYRYISERLKKIEDGKELKSEKKECTEEFKLLREKYNVTFDYARKYGEFLRKKFSLPDAVTSWCVCEMVWDSIEGLLYRDSKKVYFYKRTDLITFQGKQSNRSIVLKQDKDGSFYVSFKGMKFPVTPKENDIFIEETLSHI